MTAATFFRVYEDSKSTAQPPRFIGRATNARDRLEPH